MAEWVKVPTDVKFIRRMSVCTPPLAALKRLAAATQTSGEKAEMTLIARFGKRAVLMVLVPCAGVIVAPAAQAAGPEDMTFFLTSVGSGKGADLGGLDGADAHCASLAAGVGNAKTNWRAYLSTTAPGGDAGVNARDRIGKGPWQNVKGVAIAKDVDDLHSQNTNLNKETALTEKGEIVPGRVDPVNTHDVLTGSDPQGMYSTAGGDTTCSNWTKSGDDGSAIVGHHDHMGLKVSRHMMSWNSAHGTRGCSQEGLKSTGGAGLFYCFVAN
jgi:hypothetical protein